MKMQLHETKNDLHEKTRRAMIELLNQQLADVIDLGLQAKQAHWNVKDPHFIGLQRVGNIRTLRRHESPPWPPSP